MKLALSHIGVHCTDIARMKAFYTRVLGFTVTDEGPIHGGHMVFLSRDPRDHHQIALATGRPAGSYNVVNQISLRAGSLDDLRRVWAAVKAENAKEINPVSHGIAWSVYFHDPEGNRVEVFVDTPWYVAQPRRDPLDLTRSDAEIEAATLALIEREPSFRPVGDWRAAIGKTMAAASG